MIDTTVNIHIDVLMELLTAVDVLGKSKSEIIVMLIKKIMKHDRNMARICRRVKYQERCEKSSWRRIQFVSNGR